MIQERKRERTFVRSRIRRYKQCVSATLISLYSSSGLFSITLVNRRDKGNGALILLACIREPTMSLEIFMRVYVARSHFHRRSEDNRRTW